MAIPTRLILLLLLSSLLFGFLGIGVASSLGGGGDWLAYYAAGLFLKTGKVSEIYNLSHFQSWQLQIGDRFFPFLYAPVYALLFFPLAVFPIPVARILWFVVGLIGCIVAARFSSKWAGLPFSQNTLVLASFGPLAYSLSVGQVSPITLLLFTIVGGQEWNEEHGFLPGFVAGLVLYKPQLLIPILFYWTFNRRWRTISGFGLSGGMVGFTSFMISPVATRSYLSLSTRLTEVTRAITERGSNVSFYSISPFLGILISVVVIVLLVMASKRSSSRYAHAALWLAPVIVTPFLGIYDLLLLALPVTFLFRKITLDRYLRWAIIFVWLSPILATISLKFHFVTVSALILFFVCILRAIKDPMPGYFPRRTAQDLS